jgi:hypothetical protein
MSLEISLRALQSVRYVKLAGPRSYFAPAGGRYRVGTICGVFIDWLIAGASVISRKSCAPSKPVA